MLWRLEQLFWALWAAVWLLILLLWWTGALIAADRSMGDRDPGLRYLASAAWLAGGAIAAGVGWRRLRRRFPRHLVAWAERQEKREPEWGTRFSTAVAFLTRSDIGALGGSGQLRDALVEQVASEVTLRQWRAMFPWRAVVSAGIGMAVLAGSVTIVLHASPSVVHRGLRRLAQPWLDLPWPRRVQLVVVEAPQVLGKGGTFRIEVRNRRGALPAEVRFHLRFLTSSKAVPPPAESTYLMQVSGDAAVLQIDRVSRSFEYRITGGDDDTMSWQRVRVVERPRWETVVRRIHPPAYTHLPFQEAPAAIRALHGSIIELAGHTDRPVRHVELLTDTMADVPSLALRDDSGEGTTWRLPTGKWQVTRSGGYRLRITTNDGLVSLTEPAPVEVLIDHPPDVRWTETGSSIVLPGSRVQLPTMVTDDVGIAELRWQVMIPGQPTRVYSDERLASSRDSASPPLTRWESEFIWKVPPGMAAEVLLEVTATAVDTKGQTSTTEPLTMRVVTGEVFTRRLRDLQDRIALRLAEAADHQKQTWQAANSKSALSSSRRSSSPTWWKLAARHQADVDAALTGGEDAAIPLARQLLQWFDRHPIKDESLRELAQQFLQDWTVRGQNQREAIRRAWSLMQAGQDGEGEQRRVVEAQQAFHQWLETWSARWSRKREAAEIRHQLAELQERQAELRRRTEQLRREALANPPDDFERQLRGLARRQSELKRAWEAWSARVRRSSKTLGTRTAQELAGLAVGPAMEEAAQRLARRSTGPAVRAQRRAEKLLTEALGHLRSAGGTSNEKTADSRNTQVHILAERVTQWIERARTIREQTLQSGTQVDRADDYRLLAQQQQRLSQEVASEAANAEWHPAVRMVLNEASALMARAQTQLEEHAPAEKVAEVQQQSIDLLVAILPSTTKSGRTERPGSPPKDGRPSSPTGAPPARLLYALQSRILAKTRQLDRRRRREGLTPELAAEIRRLARQQAELVTWITGSPASPSSSDTKESPSR